jgi:hypothetical protein
MSPANLDTDDKAAAAVVIPPKKTPNPNPKTAPCYSDKNNPCIVVSLVII